MKPIKESSPKTRRKFDQTFKREAVGNWLSSGKSAAVVAKDRYGPACVVGPPMERYARAA